MTASFQTDGAGLRAEQNAGDELDYTLDWAESLEGGDEITESEWTSDPGISVGRKSHTASTATCWLSGGIADRWYRVTNTIVTETSRRESRSFRVFVRGADVGAGVRSVFPDLAAAVATMRRDKLLGVQQTYLAGQPVSDEYLLAKLLAAEAAVERQLRVFLTPVEILPSGATQEERAAFDADGVRWIEEPGYDHERGQQTTDAWGALSLRQRPVIAIHGIRFAFPSVQDKLLDIPDNWIRLDKKYGRLQLVPVQSASYFGAASGLILTSMSTGMTLPGALQIRYRAGLQNVARDYPDLLNLITKTAVLDLIDDLFLASGGSTSVDGLSQSFTFSSDTHRQAIDQKLDRLRQSILGIRLAVF